MGRGSILRLATPSYLKKHYFYLNSSGASYDRDSSRFKTCVKRYLYGFLLRYVTLSYLNLLRNCELLKFEVKKQCLRKMPFTTYIIINQTLLLDFELQKLAVSKSVEIETRYSFRTSISYP